MSALRALVVVDVQNDFCEGGSLAVAGGAAVATAIAGHLHEHARDYAAIVATADWHVDPGDHVSDTPDFVDSWPVHCVADSPGAGFHPNVVAALDEAAEAVFRKGEFSAAYSGFEGATTESDGTVVTLADWLHDAGIGEVDVVGIATDHCVRATALDAHEAGFHTRVLLDLTAGVSPDSTTTALAQLRTAGIELSGTPRTS